QGQEYFSFLTRNELVDVGVGLSRNRRVSGIGPRPLHVIESRKNADRDCHEKSHRGEYSQSREDIEEGFVWFHSESKEDYNVAGESDEEGQVEIVALSEVEPSTKQRFPEIHLIIPNLAGFSTILISICVKNCYL